MKSSVIYQPTSEPLLKPTSRRSFIATIVAAPFALGQKRFALGARLLQKPPVTSPASPNSRAFDFTSLSSWIIPNSEFFIRSHFGVPKIEAAPWTLSISGAVENARTLTMEDILKLPAADEVVTIECAGNLVGWGGVSNARWRGVSLASLIKSLGVKSEAREVVLVGADGGIEREAGGIHVDAYARSIPLSKALDAATMLVFMMNGEPLGREHGGPLRALIPGLYGMDSVKWLKQIVVSREPFKGFYQQRRYYEARNINGVIERGPLGPLRLKSQIARPINNETIKAGARQVVGAAWCGDAEIARVELSFDRGRTWKEAKLGEDRAPFAWRLWSCDWTAREGTHEIIARARDTRGRAQPLERDPSIITPYANNWADRRKVFVNS